MKQGTVSVLIGIHSPVHSTLVLISWVILYHKLPALWQIVCIYLHDIGHIGRQYHDDPSEKNEHWKLGARMAKRLFGQRGYDMCAGHCHASHMPSSLLMKPDKYSWYIAPRLWLLTNNLVEPQVRRGLGRWEEVNAFKSQVRRSIESGQYRSTHDMYLERCREQKEKNATRY